MILQNLFSFIFGVFMTLLMKRLFGRNIAFFKIIEDFQKQLPPKAKTAGTNNEDLVLQHVDINTLKTYITTKEIDFFKKQLEDFDYCMIIFKKQKIKNYSENLQRIMRTTEWEEFEIALLQEIIENKDGISKKPFLFGPKISKYINC